MRLWKYGGRVHYASDGRSTACHLDYQTLTFNNPKLETIGYGEPSEETCPTCLETFAYQQASNPAPPKPEFGWRSIGRGLRAVVGVVAIATIAFCFYIGLPWILDHVGTKDEECGGAEVCKLAQGGTNAAYEVCYCP